MIRVAYRDGLMPKNPCEFVTAIKGQPEEKDVLSLDEIKVLSQTPTEAKEVKKAFLFSCLTGLRWCDVKALEWSQIKNGTLKVRQSKTSKIVSVNLNKSALKQIGEPGEGLVFDLPTANGANKSLQLWVTRAKISKKITWHSARHSFGTNLIFEGSDIVTTMTLLGHASLKYTQRYTRASEQLKQRATDKMDVL
jgi:site-specific recombinase XerD